MVARRISIIAMLGVAALVLFAILSPDPASTQTGQGAETVTVTGAGKVEGPPDLATVTFGIRNEATTAEEAMDGLAVKQNRVLEALYGIGLTKETATTSGVDLDRRYERVGDDRRFTGYVAGTSIRAETEDLDGIGEIIDVGVRAGAERVRGIDFERTNQNEAIKEALAAAMDLARTKAEVLAQRAGRQLGRAVTIEEGGSRAPRRFTFGTDELASGGTGGASARLIINPPTQITSAKIVVTFILE